MRQLFHGAIVGILVVSMTWSPAHICAQPPAETQPAPRGNELPVAQKPAPDLDYITPDAVAAVVAYPRAVLTSPNFADYPIEILSAAGKKEAGIDPVEIEQAIAIAEPPVAGPPGAVIVLKMTNAIGSNRVLPMLWPQTVEDTLDGKTYRKGRSPMDPGIYQADEKTLIVGTDALLRKVVAAHAAPQASKLKTMLGRGGSPDLLGLVLIEPLRPLANAALTQAPPLPPQLADAREVPNLVNYVALKANLSEGGNFALSVRANDEAAADRLQKLADTGIEMFQQSLEAEAAKQEANSDPVQQATGKYMKRLSKRIAEIVRPKRKGSTLTLAGGGSGQMQMATIGILLGLLLPAVQSAREAGRRVSSQNNLKQIMIAMLSYETANGTLPPQAICDAQGKPLLSWRVAVLPYIDQDALYKQFHLDEPWDSPHNRTLLASMPKIYVNPSSPSARPGMANYLAVCGKGLMFEGTKGRKMTEITDGTSNTIAVVEADDDHAVEWTKPQDWDYDDTKPMDGLGHAHPNGFNAAFADGAVRFLSSSIDTQTFHSLLTIANGEAVSPP